jgi:hypothetical protein
VIELVIRRRESRGLGLACGLVAAVVACGLLAGCDGPAAAASGRVTGIVQAPRSRVQTARKGRFHGILRPGVYLVRAFTDHEGGGLCRPARLVRVTPGRTTHLRLICIYEIG